MARREYRLIQFDDWEVFMNQNTVLAQGHSLSAAHILDALDIDYTEEEGDYDEHYNLYASGRLISCDEGLI